MIPHGQSLIAAFRPANQQGELSFNPIRGTLKRGVENFLYRRPRNNPRITAPIGYSADRNAQVFRV